MILGCFVVLLYIVFLYFKVFRGNHIWINKNGAIQKRKASALFIILQSTYRFMFRVKDEDRLEFFKLIHKFSPRYLRIKFWKFDYVMVYDPDLCKKVFNSHLACQRPFRNCFQLEKGLLSSEYHYWRTSRKLLNGAFNLNVLKGFVPIFSSYAGNVIEEMKEHLDGKEFDVLVPLAKLTARSVAATILNVHGIEVASYDNLIESVKLFLEFTCKRMIYPPLQIDFIYRMTNDYQREKKAREYAIKYGDQLIAESRERKAKEISSVDENGNIVKKKDVKVEYIIDQLVNHEEKFTDEEIREHILILLITASETSARYVCTTLLYLAIHQNIQQKVYEEICNIFGEYSENLHVDYEKLNSCKYLEMVLKETLRLFTPVPISARETIDKFDIGIGRPLEKGAKIFLFNYILHRRKDLWGENANTFDPENFSPENLATRDPYCYIPFGAGPRGCIGNRFAMISAKVETLRLLHAYKFITKFKGSEIKQGLSLTGKLTVDYLMSIEKR